jgi:hypothetical protein
MVDVDPFLTTLYVMADDFCKPSLPPEPHPGPQAALRQSEVVTVAMFGQWQNFGSERGFYRYAQRHLRAAFPSLPTREQFNRHVRQQHTALVAFFRHLVRLLAAQRYAYEALDSSGVPTRDAKRRGAGWLPGLADSGWSNRLGWYAGFHVLLAVPPWGMITGFGFGPASTKDQPLAETFFALRRSPHPGLASVGLPACGPYVVDKGFEGHANHQPWWRAYGAQVICPPKPNSRVPWPKRLRRWLAGVRQIVETVYEKRWHTFRLDRERPPDLRGFQARLAAKIALHNFCLWLHEQLGRPRLAFADLVAW